jgi:hypothetical protein
MKDFKDEISGYILNEKIILLLSSLELKKGQENIAYNLLKCYTELVNNDIFNKQELDLVKAWIKDYNLIMKKNNI